MALTPVRECSAFQPQTIREAPTIHSARRCYLAGSWEGEGGSIGAALSAVGLLKPLLQDWNPRFHLQWTFVLKRREEDDFVIEKRVFVASEASGEKYLTDLTQGSEPLYYLPLGNYLEETGPDVDWS